MFNPYDQVYLAAITGHVPSEMVKCLVAFLDFCYVVWHNAITAEDLTELQVILDRFHFHCAVFIDTLVLLVKTYPYLDNTLSCTTFALSCFSDLQMAYALQSWNPSTSRP